MTDTTPDLDDGGPAFAHGDPTHGGHPGMSLRDWFAGQVLVGLLASERPYFHIQSKEKAAITAYEYADAMLSASPPASAAQQEGDAPLSSKPDFHDDPVEQLAFELAFELEHAELSPDDYVTVNREKLTAISRRVLDRSSTAVEAERARVSVTAAWNRRAAPSETLREALTNLVLAGEAGKPDAIAKALSHARAALGETGGTDG